MKFFLNDKEVSISTLKNVIDGTDTEFNMASTAILELVDITDDSMCFESNTYGMYY